MRLGNKNIIISFAILLMAWTLSAQNFTISGVVKDQQSKAGIPELNIILEPGSQHATSNNKGEFIFENLQPGNYKVKVYLTDNDVYQNIVEIKADDVTANFQLDLSEVQMEEVVINDDPSASDWDYLKNVEGTAIYAGKKNDVIYIDKLTVNLATNNSRQVYSKVSGLNIWESDGAGVQLGIGVRGLSPNRTSNFNTRQNGYDISADALGYPESYYTPPTEAIDRIELVRGAASLQYGTQFGGMLNFVMKKGATDKKFELKTRQSVGSFSFYNNFTSVGGTVAKKKLNYYAYYQYKRSDGWRPNSGFYLHSGHASLNWKVGKKINIGGEYSFMKYEAQQPGGLTDMLFNLNPNQSIRDRNWFKVNWNLFALTMDYQISPRTKLNIRNFGLAADRSSLGYLGQINRPDPGGNRDLIYGQFSNYGNETRILSGYDLWGNPSTFLAGFRYYKGNAIGQQGDASDGSGPEFQFINPTDPEHSNYKFPSRNISIFVENVFALSPKFSVTPGLRFEHIYTASNGYYVERYEDLAGNVIYEEKQYENLNRKRELVLGGIGFSFKQRKDLEVYSNISQNYRAINFNDLRVVNPNLIVDPDIEDERGFNADLGVRGKISNIFSYDISAFFLWYNNRIGNMPEKQDDFTEISLRTNIGNSRNIGLESMLEVDVLKLFAGKECKSSISTFVNFAYINARYVNLDVAAYNNRIVELVPTVNLKTGVSGKWNKLSANLQLSYASQQYTDATNSEWVPNAIYGIIPSYSVLDFSMGYQLKQFRFEGSINNFTNNMYFTRRATGYPGPGIIPSMGRSFFLTLEYKL